MQQDDIYFIADQRESTAQIETFARQVANKFKGFGSVNYPDWESILIALGRWTDKRFTLFIDEFPYLVKIHRNSQASSKNLEINTFHYHSILYYADHPSK